MANSGEKNTNSIIPAQNDALVFLLPEDDTPEPEISIVIPAMNEETVVSEFLDWCHEGIEKAGVSVEILIISSSTDQTAKIALAKGARVLEAPKRGLGRAYVDAIPLIRGKYAILGDANCTYDFREVAPFVERFRDSFEYIMGSRFEGSIEDGAMPGLLRYFGTPLTTFILNVIYCTKFTDIHCGMRGNKLIDDTEGSPPLLARMAMMMFSVLLHIGLPNSPWAGKSLHWPRNVTPNAGPQTDQTGLIFLWDIYAAQPTWCLARNHPP